MRGSSKTIFIVLVALLVIGAYYVIADVPEGDWVTSPADGTFFNTQNLTIVCTTPADNGTAMTNISLFTNYTGSAWKANQTIAGMLDVSTAYTFYLNETVEGEISFGCFINTSDNAGNWSSTNHTVTRDVTTPILVTLFRDEVNASENNNTISNSTTQIFGFNAIDINLNTVLLYVNLSGSWVVNGTNSSPTSGVNSSFTIVLPEGNYVWSMWTNDSANNTAYFSGNYSLAVDTTVPNITLISPSDGGSLILANRTAEINYRPQDNIGFNTSVPGFCYVYTNQSGDGTFNVNETIASASITNNGSSYTNITFSGDGYFA
ncbi:MAG: hypothetical protein ABIH34_04280, partial [Nanoarchaeota archaeon]